MRYKTAAIVSAVIIGSMFGLPIALKALFLPSLSTGIAPTSVYETILVGVAVFCFRFRWVLALPIAVTLFLLAVITTESGRTIGGRPTR